MNIIELYENLKGSYKRYLESFITIKDERIKDKVRDSIKNEELWPKALIQFNTNFAKGIGVMVPPCISSSTHLSHIIKTKVTYNEESFTNIYSNMQEYGIKIEDINKANVDVHLVYTIKGSQSMEFMQMLTTLYGCYFKN